MSPNRAKFVFLLLISLPFSLQQSCESFGGVEVHDYALLGYSFDFSNTRDSYSCAHRCLSHDQCKSYNYALSGAQQGLCELNSVGRDASKPLQYRPGFVFVQAVMKQKMPCKSREPTPSETILQEKPTKAIPEASPSNTIPPTTPLNTKPSQKILQETPTKTIPEASPSNAIPQTSPSNTDHFQKILQEASSTTLRQLTQSMAVFPATTSLTISPVASFSSCFDHWKDGARSSGNFTIHTERNKSFDVYCDFGSESRWVWTLVMSQSHKNRAMSEFRSTPFSANSPVNEENPNWEAYRLSLENMKHLKSQSTHWRVTCSFPAHGVDYTDYVRANFAEFDPLTVEGWGVCKKVGHMNVRGHSCTGCTSAWWQKSSEYFLHHDSGFHICEFGSTAGHVFSEDNFGFYGSTNPQFRCSSSDNSSTNHWFGRRV